MRGVVRFASMWMLTTTKIYLSHSLLETGNLLMLRDLKNYNKIKIYLLCNFLLIKNYHTLINNVHKNLNSKNILNCKKSLHILPLAEFTTENFKLTIKFHSLSLLFFVPNLRCNLIVNTDIFSCNRLRC